MREDFLVQILHHTGPVLQFIKFIVRNLKDNKNVLVISSKIRCIYKEQRLRVQPEQLRIPEVLGVAA